MSEFIPLACPACGGQLEHKPGDTTCICGYCGTKHMLKQGAKGGLLEHSNACPKCRRNDQVKLLAVEIRKDPQIEERLDLSHLQEPEMTGLDIKWKNSKTGLFEVPGNARTYNILVSTFGLIGIALFITSAILSYTNLFGFFIFAGLVALGVGIKFYSDRSSKENDVRKANDFTLLIQSLMPVGSEKVDFFSACKKLFVVKALFSELYYCERDDIAFLPGAKEGHRLEDVICVLFKYV